MSSWIPWWLQVTLALTAIVIALIYYYFTDKFQYWSNKRVKFLKPYPIIGSLGSVIAMQEHFLQYYQRVYNQYRNEPYVGIYQGRSPCLIIIDPEIAKNILVKDFPHFVNHGFLVDDKADPLEARNLFNLEDHKWKEMRAKLTPTFTSGRLKTMFPLLLEVSEQLEEQFTKLSNSQEIFEAKDLLARFTIDMIGSCAFGVKCTSLDDPNCEFHTMGKRLVESDIIRTIKGFLIFFVPEISRKLRLAYIDTPTTEFFRALVKNVIEHRITSGETRNDFMQLLIELKENGRLADEFEEDEGPVSNPENGELYANFPHSFTKFTPDDVTAQAMVFFFAGFETTSSVMSFAFLELAINPEVQQKVQIEIDEVMQRHENVITYQCLQELNYMDCVLKETLRKYPPFPITQRKCCRNYVIPSTKLALDKDVMVSIPIHALHNDPKYFPEPDRFDPDRFIHQQHKNKFVYLPFGEGPRMCIGNRLAIMQLKLGLISALRNFDIKLSSKTEYPPTFNVRKVVLNCNGGIWLQAMPRQRV